eukprot:TRINITY_DN23134_c0_g3_i1.p1 TRINITY_DN23134_c0_g3~~TRINITY_DN23134_c0_g3_i1.p1  ORF type:complete len:241 (-),score=50.46 TRINITY_DN23134_c0_g3_i1:796-1518(-)
MNETFKHIAAILNKGIGHLGYARIDHTRHSRCGFPEFIYGAGKTAGQISGIIKELNGAGTPVLCTRTSPEKAEQVRKDFPEAEYCELSECLLIQNRSAKECIDFKVMIVSAGTSDLGVAYEARHTVELCGCRCELINDVGVAGLHRLLAEMDTLSNADVIIAVAGMEGALPSVIGGLVKCPVIAVPTSVGYGVSAGGFTALGGMLSSCASGLTVVNIDNGFGAGCAAVRMSGLKNSTITT